eukprot:UN33340
MLNTFSNISLIYFFLVFLFLLSFFFMMKNSFWLLLYNLENLKNYLSLIKK